MMISVIEKTFIWVTLVFMGFFGSNLLWTDEYNNMVNIIGGIVNYFSSGLAFKLFMDWWGE